MSSRATTPYASANVVTLTTPEKVLTIAIRFVGIGLEGAVNARRFGGLKTRASAFVPSQAKGF